MPRISLWWKLAAVGFVCYVLVGMFGAGSVRGQKEDDKEKAADKDKDKKEAKPASKYDLEQAYYGLTGCQGGRLGKGCHNLPSNEPMPAATRDLVCRSNEIKFWADHDKHATAYRVLITQDADAKRFAESQKALFLDEEWKAREEREAADKILSRNERAKRMEEILAKTDRAKAIAEKAPDKKYRLVRDPDCLACHAQLIQQGKGKFVIAEKGMKGVAGNFRIEEGVNCVVCHGPYRKWAVEHTGIPDGYDRWRAMDRETKENTAGMTDLWDPVKRTKLCASCHIGTQGGDHEPRKFVTHEMYAAGHPPLPGFEVAALSNEMPRHWDYLRDKNDTVLKHQKIDKKVHEHEQTQLVLIGAAVALAETMRLVAAEARAEKGDGLDWSNFDCYACHHGLEQDAWRQKRGYGGRRPGRLSMRGWAEELVRLSIAYADEKNAKAREDDLHKKLNAVKDAFTSRMYGNVKEIAATADDLAKWADKLAADVNAKAQNAKSPMTAAEVKALYEKIPDVFDMPEPTKYYDFDSARQIGWGFKTMYYEEKRLEWFDKDGKKATVPATFAKIDEYLKLRLPVAPRSIDAELGKSFDALNSYHPAKFNDLLRALKKGLGKE